MSMYKEADIRAQYETAREQYAALGVDTEKAMNALKTIPVSFHCWQGDDVNGFENTGMGPDGGIQCTGNYPGRAATPDELRADLDKAFSLIPGTHRVNLHAIYGEGLEGVDRDQITPAHFQGWIDWAKERGLGLDFNPTCFSHPKAESGFTLSHPNEAVRKFWVRHCIACREIAEHMGRELGTPSVTNIWIPDGFKDIPVDRKGFRDWLLTSLDEVLEKKLDPKCQIDAVESKLFGIGAESCTIGSHEFYMGYASTRGVYLCLDTGHFHPTEVVSDKLSAVIEFVPGILLHVSRPVRWDSDHVVLLDSEIETIAREIIRNNLLERVKIGLDFFDATINRIAAWVIGGRNMLKALCFALLEPSEELKQAEAAGDYTRRLAVLEELKSMPCSAVWNYYCLESGAPVGMDWYDEVKAYEKDVLSGR